MTHIINILSDKNLFIQKLLALKVIIITYRLYMYMLEMLFDINIDNHIKDL